MTSSGEKYCRAFPQVYGLETVCLRYFNVFARIRTAQQTARIMLAFEPVLLKHRPDRVIVIGDVNSTPSAKSADSDYRLAKSVR